MHNVLREMRRYAYGQASYEIPNYSSIITLMPRAVVLRAFGGVRFINLFKDILTRVTFPISVVAYGRRGNRWSDNPSTQSCCLS